MLRIICWYSIFLSAKGTVHSPKSTVSLQSTNFLQFYYTIISSPSACARAKELSAAWCQWRSSIGKLEPSITFFLHVMKSFYPFFRHSFVHPTLTNDHAQLFNMSLYSKFIIQVCMMAASGLWERSNKTFCRETSHKFLWSAGRDMTCYQSPSSATRTLG